MVTESSRIVVQSAADPQVSSPKPAPAEASRFQEAAGTSVTNNLQISSALLAQEVVAAKANSEVAAPAKPGITKDKAFEFAKEIEKELNKSKSSTVVKFNVSLVDEANPGDSSFKFQIVERSTGRVVRQFPPEDILNIRDRIKATPPQSGILLDNLV